MKLSDSKLAGLSGIIGGILWALTPLRQPIFDAGRTADEGVLFFRAYNGALIVIAILLTIALLHVRASMAIRRGGRSYLLGWWTVLMGHALLALGSLPALIHGARAENLVTAGQDLGFLGAMIAALASGFHGAWVEYGA